MVTGNYLGRRNNTKKVNGLRSFEPPPNVKVYDASTMKLKRIESPDGKVKRRQKWSALNVMLK